MNSSYLRGSCALAICHRARELQQQKRRAFVCIAYIHVVVRHIVPFCFSVVFEHFMELSLTLWKNVFFYIKMCADATNNGAHTWAADTQDDFSSSLFFHHTVIIVIQRSLLPLFQYFLLYLLFSVLFCLFRNHERVK